MGDLSRWCMQDHNAAVTLPMSANGSILGTQDMTRRSKVSKRQPSATSEPARVTAPPAPRPGPRWAVWLTAIGAGAMTLRLIYLFQLRDAPVFATLLGDGRGYDEWAVRIAAGDPIVVLAGVHIGCFELFGTDRVGSIRDLKGKTVAVIELDGSEHIFLNSMAAYVGLDPRKDIHFVAHPVAESIQLLAEGKIDAFLGFPPIPQELRARKIGRSVVNSTVDRPWSQYFCCVATANLEFVRRHPVATKRALRAILMANSICAIEPDRVARHLVDHGFTKRYDYALQTLKDIPYSRWRDYHPEDTFRFYALRLHEAGMIKVNPNKLVVQGTDWRFLNELKKELKG